jgi:cytochrome b561
MQQVSPMATRYDGPTIWFHWTVVCLVLVQWLLAQVIDWFPLGMPRIEARSVHISLGLFLGVLLLARVVWRATRGRVLPPADRGALQILAKAVHYTLYILLIAMVAVGLFLVWVRDDSFFGLPHNIEELHGTIATIILILAGLHAAASLIHHYLWHHNVLRRMLPSSN